LLVSVAGVCPVDSVSDEGELELALLLREVEEGEEDDELEEDELKEDKLEGDEEDKED